MKTKPWDAHLEDKLHIVKETCFFGMVGCVAGVVVAIVRSDGRLAWAMAAGAVAFVLVIVWINLEITAMKPNRPRTGTAGLTQWTFWPHDQVGFVCKCGRWLSFQPTTDLTEPAPMWSPNDGSRQDPGGGRFCVVCPCGQGHFKYRIASRNERLADHNFGSPLP